MKLLSCVQLFTTPWSAAYQAPPSMGFSRQEYWSGVPLPSPQSYSIPCLISDKNIIAKLKTFLLVYERKTCFSSVSPVRSHLPAHSGHCWYQMCLCGGVSHIKSFFNTGWVSYNLILTLPGDHIRSHRLKAQSHKSAPYSPHFRCKSWVQIITSAPDQSVSHSVMSDSLRPHRL